MPITHSHAQFLHQFLANNLHGELAMTLGVIVGLDDEALTLRLAENLPTVATELHHSFSSGPWFLSVIRRGHAEWSENSVVPFKGSASMLVDACRALSEETKGLLASFSMDELVKEVDFNDERFPAVYMIDWHIVYLVHHRAIAVSTLVRHGLNPPSLYGPN
jgi:uncharacterized damage-inducible protein DinB